MKHMKTVVIPATTKDVVEKVTCDFCNKPIIRPTHEVNEVNISYRHGVSYPEGSWGEVTEIDCCPNCWNTKVLRALEDLMAPDCSPTTRYYD